MQERAGRPRSYLMGHSHAIFSDGSQNSGPMTGGRMYLAEGSWAPIGALIGGPPGMPGSPRPAVPNDICEPEPTAGLTIGVSVGACPEAAAPGTPAIGKDGCSPACPLCGVWLCALGDTDTVCAAHGRIITLSPASTPREKAIWTGGFMSFLCSDCCLSTSRSYSSSMIYDREDL